jgi:hypothetical protein
MRLGIRGRHTGSRRARIDLTGDVPREPAPLTAPPQTFRHDELGRWWDEAALKLEAVTAVTVGPRSCSSEAYQGPTDIHEDCRPLPS